MLRFHHPRVALTFVVTVGMLAGLACTAPTDGAGAGAQRTGRTAPASVPVARGTAASAPSDRITADAAPNMVWMGDHYFSPDKLTVKVGTPVTWRMLGSQEHDVWSLDGSFHSPTMGPGSIYTHTFTKVGTFRYICLPHNGDGMTGEIIVVL